MARLHPDTVDRLIDLLRLPVGDTGDERPESMAYSVPHVSRELGLLVFGDENWYAYDARRVEDTLGPWFDEVTSGQFDMAAFSGPEALLAWIEQMVSIWRSAEAGAAGPATEHGEHGALGIENPHFEPDRVPGTEFYRYIDEEYRYAATADAPHGEWQTLETRYDESRVAAEESDGRLRGYRYESSVLPGTEYYRVENGTYLYGPHEFGAAADWQPYEHWQELSDAHSRERELLDALDAFIALVDGRIEQTTR